MGKETVKKTSPGATKVKFVKVGGVTTGILAVIAAAWTGVNRSNVLDAKILSNKEYIGRVDKRQSEYFKTIQSKLDTIILMIPNNGNR